MSRYHRYGYNDSNLGPFILLIIVIIAIILGFKYKTEIKLFLFDTYNQVTDSHRESISLESAERFFYNNKDTFEKASTTDTIEVLFVNDIYISIIDRYDFGGHIIRAFRFQTTGDMGTEIIYSKDELKETSLLKQIEKHWYVYNFVEV